MSPTPSSRRLRQLTTTLSLRALGPLRAASFWLAIAMPFGYLTIFAFDLVEAPIELFLLLLVVNALALFLGRHHKR